MTVNIVAIATGAFMGLLGLVAIVACVPPITRFLGDLFCCPWRLPFTKKKRSNEDEDVDQDDLPYTTIEPRAGTPVDNDGYQRTSLAYMSAVSVVDPATAAMEEMRRSTDLRRSYSPSPSRYDAAVAPSSYASSQSDRDHSPPRVPEHHHMMAHHDRDHSHLAVPRQYSPSRSAGGAPWRGPTPSSSSRSLLARSTNYPPIQNPYSHSNSSHNGYDAQHDDHRYSSDSFSYSSADLGAAAPPQVPLQLPAPSHHGQPEMSMHGAGTGVTLAPSALTAYAPARAAASNNSSRSFVGGAPSQWTNV